MSDKCKEQKHCHHDPACTPESALKEIVIERMIKRIVMSDRELIEQIKEVVHRRKYTCTIPNEDFDEIIALCNQSKWISVEESEAFECPSYLDRPLGCIFFSKRNIGLKCGKSPCLIKQPLPSPPEQTNG